MKFHVRLQRWDRSGGGIWRRTYNWRSGNWWYQRERGRHGHVVVGKLVDTPDGKLVYFLYLISKHVHQTRQAAKFTTFTRAHFWENLSAVYQTVLKVFWQCCIAAKGIMHGTISMRITYCQTRTGTAIWEILVLLTHSWSQLPEGDLRVGWCKKFWLLNWRPPASLL